MTSNVTEKSPLFYDLFEHYDLQPPHLKVVVEKWSKNSEFTYYELEQFLKDVESVGYTFDYYLDAEPYGLRPIGVKLNQLEGWKDF